MPTIVVERTIHAPVERIFDAVANIENLPNTSEDVESIEFLTERRRGAGTRFIETRRHRGKTMLTELEVTEFEEGAHARMVADSHGTIWDTRFTVTPTPGGGRLRIAMEARGTSLLTRTMNVLMQFMFRRGMSKHIDAVKAHCERGD